MAFIVPSIVFAAESPGSPVAENPISLAMFASIATLTAGIVAITLFVKNAFNTSGLITDIVSWVLGPVLGLIGFLFNFGMFADIMWYTALLYGLLAAFSANKGYDLASVLFNRKDMNYKKTP